MLAERTGATTGTSSLRWEHLNPVTGNGRETDTAGRVVTATHLDPTGTDVGESDPFAGAAGDPGVLSVYSRSQRRYVGLAVWDPAAAAMGVDFFRDGHAGYLPAGVSYHSHSSTPFSGPGWTAQWQGYINYAWADSWEKDKWDEPTSTLTARNNGGFVPDGTEDKEAAEIVA